MTQNTRLALTYGGWLMTCSTNRSKGAMPVVASQRPNTLARCTSSAAKYAQAPPRAYSCSTRIDLAGAVGRLG